MATTLDEAVGLLSFGANGIGATLTREQCRVLLINVELLRELTNGQPIPADVMALLAEVERLRAEIAIDDQLLADRNRILDTLPCSAHGPCVPHVIEWIEKMKKLGAAIDSLLKNGDDDLRCEWDAIMGEQ